MSRIEEIELIEKIIEINRVLWLDFFDDEALIKEEMLGIDKYYTILKLKLNKILCEIKSQSQTRRRIR